MSKSKLASSPAKRRLVITNPHSTISRRSSVANQRISAPMTESRKELPPAPFKTTPSRKRCKRKFRQTLEGNEMSPHALTPTPKKKRKLTPGSKQSARIRSAGSIKGRDRCPKFFRNLGIVGKGSFAKVFKVEDAGNKKIFALKQSKKRLRNRHAADQDLNEVKIMKLLQKETAIPLIIEILREEMNDDEKKEGSADIRDGNWDYVEMGNQHIAKFYDFCIARATRHVLQIYEYYEHGTLADFAKDNPRFNYLQILETLEQLCDGLQFVHSKNVIHMDLKPQNIMISSEFVFKIGDFGVSIDCNINPNETSSAKKPRLHCSGDP